MTIFVTAPVEELERRLRERATESSGVIGERIETARRQLEQQGEFDFVVENDDRGRAPQTPSQPSSRRNSNGAATMAAQ